MVLVHGAAHGAWCWELLTPKLEQRGIEVDVLDLPGLGDDPTPPQDVTFQSYVDTIRRTIESKPGRVLLLGHSMGGWPVSAVAESIPDRISRLVYLASFLPKDNETIGELARSLSRFNEPSGFDCVRPSSVPGVHEFARELAAQVFYNRCEPELARRAVARLRPQADAPLAGALRLSPARFGSIPKSYIVCTLDRAVPVSAQHWFCERSPEVAKQVMHTDHSPFYSDPEGLAELIAAQV